MELEAQRRDSTFTICLALLKKAFLEDKSPKCPVFCKTLYLWTEQASWGHKAGVDVVAGNMAALEFEAVEEADVASALEAAAAEAPAAVVGSVPS